jgi:hypothetical protein
MLKGATIDRVWDHRLEPGQEGAAGAIAHRLELGLEGFRVDLQVPTAGLHVPLTDEFCLVAADQIATLAHNGEVTDISIRRFIRSRSGRNGTLDRVGPASKDFIMTGYRMRLTEPSHAAKILEALALAETMGGAQVVVSGTSVPLPPVTVPQALAAAMGTIFRELARDPLVTVLVVNREDRLTWRQARYLLQRHYAKPPEDGADPLRGYLSLGSYRYAHILDMLAAAGIAYDQASTGTATGVARGLLHLRRPLGRPASRSLKMKVV